MVCLTNVVAPRLSRRPNPQQENPVDVKDEPYAWEAREFLRKKVIGKEVVFTLEYKTPVGREYGYIFIGKDTTGENVTESLVAEGLVALRRGGMRLNDEAQKNLAILEDTAKASAKGKWGLPEEVNLHLRDVTWVIEDPRKFVDSLHGKPIDAVIEHVRDACTVRAFLLPTFHYVTVMLSGIKAPMFKMEGDKTIPDAFAEEAKFFVESRLLNREVKIILEGVSNQNLLGSVMHPNGNIGELLLRESFARCVDWSMGVVSQGAESLRAAEKIGKEKKQRIWKDWVPSVSAIDIGEKTYTAKVCEIANGDGMVVKMADGSFKKIFLASIRPPRPPADLMEDPKKRDPKYRPRPLYDIPYMFEAREFLRKKLVGKKVNVQVDYIQPKSDDFPEKNCCTVSISNINIAEAIVSKGLATVVRYRQDDDQRSSHYDLLLAAEARAQKKGVGLHSRKEVAMMRVADVSGDVAKSKQFLPFLQRAGRVDGVVEFVASGSRLRLFIPRETCLVTFLLSGINCPRGSRPDPTKPGSMVPAEPFGDEAQAFTKEQCLQREVQVEVESMDKGGNFIGWMYMEGMNMSLGLVEEGLATVHFTAERSNHYKALCVAEAKAKEKKAHVWSIVREEEEVVEEVLPENEPQERTVSHKSVIITEVTDDLHFFAQCVDTGPQLEKLMEQLRADLTTSPPLPGSYNAKRGELCAAKFSDDEWYRAKVEKVLGNKIHVLYIDYGNREVTNSTKLGTLPATYHSLPAQAKAYALACTKLPQDEEDKRNIIDAFYTDILNRQVLLNVEYKQDGMEHVTLLYNDTKEDVAQSLISEGLILLETRREKRLNKLVTDYRKAQEKAKKSRLNLWRYGDFTEDDAKEFGYQPK